MLEVLMKRVPSVLLETPMAVVMGGSSMEREFSLRSGRRVLNVLQDLGFKVQPLEADERLQGSLQEMGAKLCFMCTHGVPGEDGKIQGYLESTGCYYTGPSVAGCALSMNKIAAKALLSSEGIKTPPWMRVERHLPVEESVRQLSERLSYPMVLKPVFGGSSIGVRLVNDRSECRTVLDELLLKYHHVMAEQYVVGREIVVSVLEDSRGVPYVLPHMEVELQSLFYDYESKLELGKRDFVVPAPLDSSIEQQLESMSKKIYEVLMQRDMSRSDFIYGEDGELYYLETNAIPGLTHNSDLPAQARAMGISFEELVLSILLGAHRRMQKAEGGL